MPPGQHRAKRAILPEHHKQVQQACIHPGLSTCSRIPCRRALPATAALPGQRPQTAAPGPAPPRLPRPPPRRRGTCGEPKWDVMLSVMRVDAGAGCCAGAVRQPKPQVAAAAAAAARAPVLIASQVVGGAASSPGSPPPSSRRSTRAPATTLPPLLSQFPFAAGGILLAQVHGGCKTSGCRDAAAISMAGGRRVPSMSCNFVC